MTVYISLIPNEFAGKKCPIQGRMKAFGIGGLDPSFSNVVSLINPHFEVVLWLDTLAPVDLRS